MAPTKSVLKGNAKFLESGEGHYVSQTDLSIWGSLFQLVFGFGLLLMSLSCARDFWQNSKSTDGGLAVLFLVLGVGLWATVGDDYRLWKEQKMLRNQGRLVTAEVTASEIRAGSKGRQNFAITYRLAPQQGAGLGEVVYSFTSEAAVRSPEVGETISVMYCGPELHRPV